MRDARIRLSSERRSTCPHTFGKQILHCHTFLNREVKGCKNPGCAPTAHPDYIVKWPSVCGKRLSATLAVSGPPDAPGQQSEATGAQPRSCALAWNTSSSRAYLWSMPPAAIEWTSSPSGRCVPGAGARPPTRVLCILMHACRQPPMKPGVNLLSHETVKAETLVCG